MTYPLLLLCIVIIGISTTAVAQLWSTRIKREKEAELLFCLGQFRQGIALFQADHNRYPQDLTDLLEDRSQLQTRRYLRRIYLDPMTGKADWMLDLVVDRSGIVSGIRDVHSRSQDKPLKVLVGSTGKTQAVTYRDW